MWSDMPLKNEVTEKRKIVLRVSISNRNEKNPMPGYFGELYLFLPSRKLNETM